MKIYVGHCGYKCENGEAVRWNYDSENNFLRYQKHSEHWKNRTTKKLKSLDEVKIFIESLFTK